MRKRKGELACSDCAGVDVTGGETTTRAATELEKAHAALDAMDARRLEVRGGYPAAWSTKIPGWTIVAAPDDQGDVDLSVYRNRDLVRWYRRAERFLRKNPEESLVVAMWETKSDGDGAKSKGRDC